MQSCGALESVAVRTGRLLDVCGLLGDALASAADRRAELADAQRGGAELLLSLDAARAAVVSQKHGGMSALATELQQAEVWGRAWAGCLRWVVTPR